jgi:phospholipase/carboxylesterase
MPLVSLRNYVAVAPRGTEPAGQAEGYSWRQDPEHVTEAEQRVLQAIAAARRSLNIASHRIYLAGYDAGGTMALRIALNQPHWFAGVASIGGAFPTNMRPLARIKELRGLQILLATGRHSRRYPESQVCRTLRLLHSAGMSVNLRQYPCGDEVTADTFADLDRWIMEQVASTAPASADQASHSSRGK